MKATPKLAPDCTYFKNKDPLTTPKEVPSILSSLGLLASSFSSSISVSSNVLL